MSVTEQRTRSGSACLLFQISKDLVEEKLQTNKMREKYEEQMFELKNKVICENCS